MKRLIALVLILTLAVFGLSGCATTDSDQTKAEGTMVGAGTGAAMGAIIGALTGGGRGAAIGAAIGAAVGGAAGYAYGTHVASEKEKYAKEEDWLDACIASAQEVNEDARQYNVALSKEMDQLDRETETLAAQYKNKQVTKAALAEEKKKVDEKLAQTQEKTKRAKWELENQEKVLAEAKAEGKTNLAQNLEKEINQLKKHITELEGHAEKLASMSNRMTV